MLGYVKNTIWPSILKRYDAGNMAGKHLTPWTTHWQELTTNIIPTSDFILFYHPSFFFLFHFLFLYLWVIPSLLDLTTLAIFCDFFDILLFWHRYWDNIELKADQASKPVAIENHCIYKAYIIDTVYKLIAIPYHKWLTFILSANVWIFEK